MLIDILTYNTGLAAGIETVNLLDFATVFGCRMFKFLHERAEGEVRHLPAPQTGHPCQPQVLHAKHVVPPAKLVSEFPLPVITTVDDILVDTVQGESGGTTMRGALLAFGQTTGSLAEFVQTLFKEQRVVHLRSVTQGEEGLQTEIQPDRCTIV